MNITTTFNGTPVQIVTHGGKRWLTAEQIGRCLGYAEANASQGIINLYNRNEDEFSEADTFVINLMTNLTQGGNPNTRIFSETGCNLLGFFASTPRAKEFRKWAKQVLADETAGLPPMSPMPDTHMPASAIDARLDRVIGLLEKLIEVLPILVAAAQPAPRRKRRQMFEADIADIMALRAQGAQLSDIVATSGFSQTQVWCVIASKYIVLPGGRVVVDQRSNHAKAATSAAT